MRIKIITTTHSKHWDGYAKRFVDSFLTYWPENCHLEVWVHGENAHEIVKSTKKVLVRNLEELEEFQVLKKVLGGDDGPSLQYCFKAIALGNSASKEYDWLAFIDADTETFFPVDDKLLSVLFNDGHDLAYLWRSSVKESEGSFFTFNLKTKEGQSLLADYYGMYASGEFLHYKKQHDNAILDRLATIHCAHGLRVRNLSPGALGLDAFHQSPLAGYMAHYKGPDKNRIADAALMVPSRYHTVAEWVVHAWKETGRAYIVETGTWNGSRAIHFAQKLQEEGCTDITYIGFDTFGETPLPEEEDHTKPNLPFDIVDRRLAIFQKIFPGRFNYKLYQGLTSTTLKAAGEDLKDATFVWIDGGHSEATVRLDYAALQHAPFVAFDDVTPGSGPEKVLDEIPGAKKLVTDNQNLKGENIALGLVVREPYKWPRMRTPVQVQPVACMPPEEQRENVRENTAALKRWLRPVQAHAQWALLCSAGPSLKSCLEEIKRKKGEGATIFAVKHAYPVLREADIDVDWLAILDPRPVDGISTHGVRRRDLYEGMPRGQNVLFATMTDVKTRELLEEKGAQLFGWHALTKSAEKQEKGLTIVGGTCTAMRLPMLAFTLGYRRMIFYGYDFCYPDDTPQETVEQKLMRVSVGNSGRSLLTTGELIAAMQDLNNWAGWLMEQNLTIEFRGEGAGPLIWEEAAGTYEPPLENVSLLFHENE